MPRKVYTEEFKQTAVRLAQRPGVPVEEVARELGVASWTLRRWMKESAGTSRKRPKAEPVSGLVESDAPDGDLRRRVRQLEAENRRLRMERDILKKAAAYFARDGLEEGQP